MYNDVEPAFPNVCEVVRDHLLGQLRIASYDCAVFPEWGPELIEHRAEQFRVAERFDVGHNRIINDDYLPGKVKFPFSAISYLKKVTLKDKEIPYRNRSLNPKRDWRPIEAAEAVTSFW